MSAVIRSAQGLFTSHAIWVIIHRVTPGPVSIVGYFIMDLDCSLNENRVFCTAEQKNFLSLCFLFTYLIYPALPKVNDAFDLLNIFMLCCKH